MPTVPCTETAVKLLPLLLPLIATLPRGRSPLAASGEDTPVPTAHRDAGEPDWRSAYRRLRDQESPEADVLPGAPAPLTAAKRAPAEEVMQVRSVSPTVERLEAAQRLADPQPAAPAAARVWQVELPGQAGPAGRRGVAQARPLAPLHLELRVPPVAQAQARQQLGDLDKRLRDAGHEVLRSRLRETARADKRSLPVDEVQP